MTDISTALILVVATAAVVGAFLWYKSTSSEWRMTHMMVRCGVDPAIARDPEFRAAMQPARRRCRRCQTEGLCDRWLSGKVIGDGDFCPNARVFEQLSHARRT